jgi:hypothetical protein
LRIHNPEVPRHTLRGAGKHLSISWQRRQPRWLRPPHGDPEITAEASLERLRNLEIPNGSAVIGISLGRLVAAKLQESGRDDLHITCISSPTWADGVALSQRMTRRLALYSSLDPVIKGRTDNWPQLAQAYDLPRLTHDTDKHKEALSYIVAADLDNDAETVSNTSARETFPECQPDRCAWECKRFLVGTPGRFQEIGVNLTIPTCCMLPSASLKKKVCSGTRRK